MKNIIFFNITALTYFLSSIFFSCHLIYNKKNKLNLTAKIFALCGFIIHTIGIIFRIMESGHAPFVNLFESLIYFSWIIIFIYLYVQFKYKLDFLGIFVLPLSFLAIAYAKTFSSDIQPLVPILQSMWLEIHVAVIFIGYGGLAVSYGCALIYLLKLENKWAFFSAAFNVSIIAALIFYFLLKIKFNQGIISVFVCGAVFVFVFYLQYKNEEKLRERLPAIDVVDKVNYNAAVYGFIFLTGGIIAGAVWADSAWGSYWSWDPKETWSLITWFIYAAYLHMRKTAGWSGDKAAYVSVYGFWAVIFTYFGVNILLPGLHSYK